MASAYIWDSPSGNINKIPTMFNPDKRRTMLGCPTLLELLTQPIFRAEAGFEKAGGCWHAVYDFHLNSTISSTLCRWVRQVGCNDMA
jgi:hypothetical protein